MTKTTQTKPFKCPQKFKVSVCYVNEFVPVESSSLKKQAWTTQTSPFFFSFWPRILLLCAFLPYLLCLTCQTGTLQSFTGSYFERSQKFLHQFVAEMIVFLQSIVLLRKVMYQIDILMANLAEIRLRLRRFKRFKSKKFFQQFQFSLHLNLTP